MIAAVVTGAGCDDPTGGHPEVNSFEKSSSESWQGPKVEWSLTTSSKLGTQAAHLSCNDYWRLLYRFGAIMTAPLVTGVGCNDPTGGHPEDNFLKRSSLESG